jgi:hypothetical protein
MTVPKLTRMQCFVMPHHLMRLRVVLLIVNSAFGSLCKNSVIKTRDLDHAERALLRRDEEEVHMISLHLMNFSKPVLAFLVP